jgi:hypothetical protein
VIVGIHPPLLDQNVMLSLRATAASESSSPTLPAKTT